MYVLAENIKKECVRTLIFLFDLIPESSALPVLIMQMHFFFLKRKKFFVLSAGWVMTLGCVWLTSACPRKSTAAIIIVRK